MKLGQYLAAMGLSVLLALPVVAQTTPPPKSPSPPAATTPKPPATATPSATDKPTGKSEPAGELVDINSASPEELDKLPGVGPARAKAIIAGRPYNGKDDLTNRKIIPANVYNGIKDKIVARQK
jgi:DNA uptake protein ComE-like DNA-binding protein